MALITTVKGNHLSAGLTKVLRVQKSNQILPILEKVKLTPIKSGFLLECSDLDTHILTGIAAKTEPITALTPIMIPPQVFAVLQQIATEEPVEIHMVGDEVNFKYGDNFIRCTNDESSAAFPSMPEIKEPKALIWNMNAGYVQKLFSTLGRFTSDDELRAHLTGVCLTQDAIFATDTFRLLKAEFNTGSTEPLEILLNRGFINALNAIDANSETLKVNYNETYFAINDKSTKIVTRVINGKAPKYQGIIPKAHDFAVKLNRTDFVRSIKLSRNVATTTDSRLKVEYGSGTYHISGQDADFSQEIKLSGTCTINKNEKGAKTFEHAINGKLFIPMLEAMTSPEIVIELNEAEKPVVIREGELTFLCMPLKLK